jgi:hypothetical protein
MITEEMLRNPKGNSVTEAPTLLEELHDHPRPIVQHPDGKILVRLK